ncbi:MAG: hypothetical protein PUG32_07465 [Bacteroidales bacterium]|nr:hypothetical protein [Bacteroidales bacterium]
MKTVTEKRYYFLLLSDKTFLRRAEKSGLAPIAGVSPFWLLCFYHKTINHGQK